MLSDYDKELLSLLGDEINNNAVLLHENSLQFIKEIEKYYPFGFSGIDWGQKEKVYHVNLKKNKSEEKKNVIDEFLRSIIHDSPELLNEKVVVIGDNLLELSYEMMFSLFIKHHSFFFDIPEHTYVWFTFSKKCVNLTFEDDLYFG